MRGHRHSVPNSRGMIRTGDPALPLPHSPSVLAGEPRVLHTHRVRSSECLPCSVSSPARAAPPQTSAAVLEYALERVTPAVLCEAPNK